MGEIRIPIKKSSIEKKERIIKLGFELMCLKGYHNVTCVDIAKYANVSTGIIYQYFRDKHDIFVEGVKDYSNKIMFPIIDIFENKCKTLSNLEEILNEIIDNFIKTHVMKKEAHEELMAMSYLDNLVGEIFIEQEINMTNKIVNIFKTNNIKLDNLEEKVHISVNLIDNLCHEIVYHKHEEMDYESMKNIVINIILNMLKTAK